jgi:hypothetical protein
MFLFAILLMQAFMYKDPVADQLIRAAMQANYDLKIDETHELTRRLQQTYPDHGSPVGYLLAAESWWESQADPSNREIYALY